MATEEATCALTMPDQNGDENLEGLEEGEEGAAPKPKPTAATALPLPIVEDGNVVINISNVTNMVAGRVGNLFTKESVVLDQNWEEAEGLEEGEEGAAPKPKPTAATALPLPIVEDGNVVINISNVTNMVAGRVGNLFGKGIGGLRSKLGGGGWF